MSDKNMSFYGEDPIYETEGDKLKKQISHLIGRHNVLCAIEKAFAENKTALEYFDDAKNEVLEAGSQSIASMFALAIQNMAERIGDDEDNENEDIEKLRMRLYHLESENRRLKTRLENIAQVVNSQKGSELNAKN